MENKRRTSCWVKEGNILFSWQYWNHLWWRDTRKTWWKKRKKTNMSINISRTRWLLAGSSKKIFFDVCHFSFFLPFFPFSFFVPLWWGWSSSCKNLVNAVKMVNCLYNILSHLVAKVKSQFLFLLRYSVNMCRNFRYKIEMAIKLC